MSLNHLVQGGSLTPALNLECENLKVLGDLEVDGNILSSFVEGDSGVATATIQNGPGGTGAGITGDTRLTYHKIGGAWMAQFKTNFQTGTGSKNLLLDIDLTSLGLTGPENLIVVANSVHQTGAGSWETLLVGVYTFQSPTSLLIDLVRPTDDVFPANKQYSANISFSFADAS